MKRDAVAGHQYSAVAVQSGCSAGAGHVAANIDANTRPVCWPCVVCAPVMKDTLTRMADNLRQITANVGCSVRLRTRNAAQIGAWTFGVFACVGLCLTPRPAFAERIENQVAVFSALDKVTARISKFEVPIGKSATFGALKVTPRTCYSRPPTEQPKTSTFVEVEELQLDGQEKRIFTGWMFAESPGLYGVEHPTVDVWLTQCLSPKKTTAQRAPAAAPSEDGATPADGGAATDAAPSDDVAQEPRRRVRR